VNRLRVAVLRGREHPELGAVHAVAERNVAVALSRGGAPKRYPHSDPNEDAAGFAFGREGYALAVADGHGGAEAAEIALLHLLGEPAEQWTEEPAPLDARLWRRQALAALTDTNRQIRRDRGGRAARAARTTLTLAVALPELGFLFSVAIGDSHLFFVEAAGVREISPAGDKVGFLGDAYEGPDDLAGIARVDVEPLAGVRAVVLATDGLSERGIGVASPAGAVAEAVRLAEQDRGTARGLVVARALTETALEAHRRNRSGDNVAVSALWLSK
jgi:serine/threonine protein phosphatase PrpC